MNEKVVERFFRRAVQKTGCWGWNGYINSTGYPSLWDGKHGFRAHRVSFEVFRGPIPKGKHVCHTCDNKACTNPDHLFLGTNQDNALDAKRKGRLAVGLRHGSRTHPERLVRGESHPNSKMTWEAIREIRTRFSSGISMCALAKDFGLARSTIGQIIQRRTWRERDETA